MDKLDYKIIEYIKNDYSILEIAEKVRKHPSTISKRITDMRENGIDVPTPKRKRRNKPIKTKNDSIDREILKRFRRGETLDQIGDALHMSSQAVSQRKKRMEKRGVVIPDAREIRKDKLDKKILDRLANGDSQIQISRDLGTSVQSRVKSMRERGIEIPDSMKIRSDKINQKILDGIAAGKSETEMSKDVGLIQTAISNRIMKMRNEGIEIKTKGNSKGKIRKTENDETDNTILEELRNNKINVRISEELGVSASTISYRIRRMKERDSEKLAYMIANLIETKGATPDQIRSLGQHYGVDVEKAINRVLAILEEQER